MEYRSEGVDEVGFGRVVRQMRHEELHLGGGGRGKSERGEGGISSKGGALRSRQPFPVNIRGVTTTQGRARRGEKRRAERREMRGDTPTRRGESEV